MIFSSVVLICVSFSSTVSASSTTNWISDDISFQPLSLTEAEPTELANVSRPCVNQEVRYYDIYKLDTKTITACVHQSKSFNLARIVMCVPMNTNICRNESWMFISSPGTNNMYKIDNLIAGPSDNCWQTSPDSNRIVYTCNGNFMVVENMYTHLTKRVYPLSGNTYFEFNDEGYKSIPINGRVYWDIRGSAAVSPNVKWAVLALGDMGIIRVNLDDFTTQIIAKPRDNINVTSSSYYHFAITDDGQYIAVGGDNTSASIIKATSTCGVSSDAIQNSWYENTPIPECVKNDLAPQMVESNGGEAAGFRSWKYLRFSYDEEQLIGQYLPYRGVNGVKSGWFTLNSAGYETAPRLDYLALGDSYTSGEGDYSLLGSHSNFMPFTDVEGPPVERCHLSKRSYPYLLRDLYAINAAAMQSVACSGAKTTDIVSPLAFYHGQNDRLKDFAKETEYKNYALNTSFTPGRAEQIDFVRKYKPHVITVGIGGNDADFAKELNMCVDFIMRKCGSAIEDGVDRKRVAALIEDNYHKLRTMYSNLKTASPDSRIYAVGYPKFINEEGSACYLNGAFVNKAERLFINRAVEYMNDVIHAAADAEGVHYVDIEDSLVGGRLCEGIAADYVTGLRNQLWLLSLFSGNRSQLYHPNAKGHAKIASQIYSSIGKGFMTTPNPAPKTTTIVANEYFGSNSEKRVKGKEYLTKTILKQGETIQADFEPGLFDSSTITVTIFSTPRQLGTSSASHDGSLHYSLQIPGDMPVGYHTIVVSGNDFAGKAIEYVQSIFVIGSDSQDIDDDDIQDSKDACFFWVSCGETETSTNTSVPSAVSERKFVENSTRTIVYEQKDANPEQAPPWLLDGEDVLSARNEANKKLPKNSRTSQLLQRYSIGAAAILLMFVVAFIVKMKRG